ncbi:uncharacterized protein [Physcomitrium patens]|uniref:Tetratricopeptide repeat protein n=1 Tax=Physcomitrium patens TaxID=3218 RepID=A0A2K1IHH7_PHYPA|nr:uncharacterized protein LOC112276447 [Physcomitrium patens]PNR28737.1 hypothetical protein PHYPA_029330 [Physcomitrium patens]|eukprot:XP_024363544.1 uncharacterized protein LOC112276447 [Physcomitrella patens]
MVAATPIPCCSCAIASRSSSSTLASTSVAAWIHDKYWRVNEPGCQFRAVRRRSSLFSWQAERYGSFRSGFCNPSTSASTSREAGRVERACCVKDSVEGVEPWPLLGGAKGWVLGMAMACLLVLGDGESLAAMRVPKSPRTGYDPVSEEEREASSAFARRVAEALDLLDKARKAQARDDFEAAFRYYSLITQTSGDLALADYARVGRALTLYEVGDRDEAIAEMEDMTLSLKGYPEVHAALAAALYTDKHAPVPAEQQFTFATLLDPRYTDPSWVRAEKHWPPSLIVSLQRFIALQ